MINIVIIIIIIIKFIGLIRNYFFRCYKILYKILYNTYNEFNIHIIYFIDI
jgi:hypothetical protein